MLRRRIFWTLLLVIIIGGGAAGYYFYKGGLASAQNQAAQQNQVASVPVATGDLVIRVDGVGNLLAAREVKLGFRTSGIVKTVAVQPGDAVNVGSTLAMLDDATARYNVAQAEVALRQAQVQLTKLTHPTATSIAEAKANLATAQAEVAKLTQPTTNQVATAKNDLLSAQQALDALVKGIDANKQTSLQATLRTAQIALDKAQSDYDKVSWRKEAGVTAESAALQDAKVAYEKAQADYNLAIAGATDDAISAARAKVSTAQEAFDQLTNPDANTVEASKAKVAAAQATLDSLLNGGNPQDVELARLAAQQAEATLHAQMIDLASAVITAPITGTVTAVDITPGQQAGSTPVITIDQAAQVRFWLDETDASRVAVGNTVNVTFGAYDSLTFRGKLVRIDPSLVTVNGSSTVQAWASIDPTQHPVNLLYNMSADVEVIAGDARNTLLVPTQALRQLTPGQFAVFVVQPSGELEMRMVQVGLKDAVNVQILEGLKAGEQVSIGTSRAAQGGNSGGNANQAGANQANGNPQAGR